MLSASVAFTYTDKNNAWRLQNYLNIETYGLQIISTLVKWTHHDQLTVKQPTDR